MVSRRLRLQDKVHGSCKTLLAFYVHDRTHSSLLHLLERGAVGWVAGKSGSQLLDQKEAAMADSLALIRRANELRDWAEHEADESVRSRLMRMADH